MLLKSLPDLRDKKVQSKLTLCKKPTPSWNSYFSQYNNVLQALINIGFLNKQTYFREFAMPFLFIFRHTIELQLKRELDNKGIQIQNRHELNINSYREFLPDGFCCNLEVLDIEGDGSCFRYISDKNSRTYFNKEDSLDLFSPIKYYITNNPKFLKMPKLRFGEEKMKAMCEYPTNICPNIGTLRTQYDTCLSLLVNSINDGKVKIDEIIIPLYFLLRHCLELGLKSNIILGLSQEASDHKIGKQLSIVLNAIDTALTEMDKNFLLYEEILDDKKYISKLVTFVEDKDNSSNVFRYPVKGANKPVELKIKDKSFLDSLVMYQECDSFLSSALQYLKYEGFKLENDEEPTRSE